MKKQISRRQFMRAMGMGTAAYSLSHLPFCSKNGTEKPNIIFILADDLGYGELGCYGQKKIRTPHIDSLARDGMRFSQHYSGSPVCAPSRCTLLTGKHTGHAYIRGNDEMRERGDVWHDPNLQGQRPLPAETFTMARMLNQAGYTTGAIGKWGLGGPNNSGDPNKQGFDFFYGYLCQRIAHNYYPDHLWRNNKKHLLEGNPYSFPHQKLPKDRDPLKKESYLEYTGNQYSMDLMANEALKFIRENQKKPFFLYLPFPVPHVALQVPDDSLQEYENAFPETPYKGEKGYTPHMKPRAAYAAMITRMDREIGRIISLLKELAIDDNTLIIFTSDNGPTYAGGVDARFFQSAGSLRGLKGSVYEGGIRVPMIASWPGRIKPGTESNHVSAFWDFLPTFADLIKTKPPEDIDGISLLPTLLGQQRRQKQHDYLYWEHVRRMQAVRMDEWKAVRLKPGEKIQLFNLKSDLEEKTDVASSFPEIIARIKDIMKNGRSKSRYFPLKNI